MPSKKKSKKEKAGQAEPQATEAEAATATETPDSKAKLVKALEAILPDRGYASEDGTFKLVKPTGTVEVAVEQRDSDAWFGDIGHQVRITRIVDGRSKSFVYKGKDGVIDAGRFTKRLVGYEEDLEKATVKQDRKAELRELLGESFTVENGKAKAEFNGMRVTVRPKQRSIELKATGVSVEVLRGFLDLVRS